MKKYTIFILLLLVGFFYFEVKGANNALIWKETGGLNYCLVAEEWKNNKKLKLKLGNCCYYDRRMKHGASTKRIKSHDNSFCLKSAKLGEEFSIIRISGSCSLFDYTTTQVGPLGCFQRKVEKFVYDECPNPIEGTFGVQVCEDSVTEVQSNLKLFMSFIALSYCWYPENEQFQDGKKIKDSRYKDCCSIGTFLLKSDQTLWLKKYPNGPNEWCLSVEGMPGHNKMKELEDKKIEITSRDCKATAFVFDQRYNMLRMIGTNKCLYRSSSQEINAQECAPVTASFKYANASCSAKTTSKILGRSTTPISSSTSVVKRTSSLGSTARFTSSGVTSSITSSNVVNVASPNVANVASPKTNVALSKSNVASSIVAVLYKSATTSSLITPSRYVSAAASPPTMSSHQALTMTSASVTSSIDTGVSYQRSSSMTSYSPSAVSKTVTTTPASRTSSSGTSPLPFVQVFAGDPVDGQFGAWSAWSKCSVECGTGARQRTRYCDNPSPINGGKDCTGMHREEISCIKPNCSGRSLARQGEICDKYCERLGLACSPSINNGNSNKDFTTSGVTCSSDERGKVQAFPYQPAYRVTTKQCSGYVLDGSLFACNASAPFGVLRLCNCVAKADKGFDEWVPWSACSLSCGGGTRTRSRMCQALNPAKDECTGNTTQQGDCSGQKCPIDGGFSEWTSWSSCSKSCGGGLKERNRTCSNPYPQYHGAICYGYYKESRSCGSGFCPVHGGWTPWTEWQHCNKPCNSGKITRQRWCENPIPMYGGLQCQGYNNQSNLCNTNLCPNSSILLTDVSFDDAWRGTLGNPAAPDFYNYSQLIHSNVAKIFDSDLTQTYARCWLHSLREGSVIASFTLYFNAMDSFQTLYLMDAVNVDHFLGKLPIVTTKIANFTSVTVPSSPPANVTAVSLDAKSIAVSWNEVPTADQNGAITGYIVFYREASALEYTSFGTMKLNATILGLSSATEYMIRVLAYTQSGNGIASKLIRIYTQEKAPSLPPTKVSTSTLSPTVIFVEWDHPPLNSWNGVLRGYKVDVKDPAGAMIKVLTVEGDVKFTNIDSLTPDTTYVVDICAFTVAGVGPCFRTFNTTFVSAPSIAPANLTCTNKTSVNSIDISFSIISLEYVHGYLKGYRVEYRLHRLGLTYTKNTAAQSVMVGPFQHKVTLKSLSSNSVYAIRVMAVNEHGDGVASPFAYAETCSCPQNIFTNYASMSPYIYRDRRGNMKGIFMKLLQNLTMQICGTCNGKASKIDYVNDGKNGWADKENLLQVTRGVDKYTHLSFVISGREELVSYLGRPYVTAVDHPGMILFIPKETVSEKVAATLSLLWKLWPIFIINVLLISLAGILFFCLTVKEMPQSESCFFGRGACTGMYWAFVTMFTHGYGDVTPNTIISRLFAVVWILIGLITSAIMIGAITSVLTASTVIGDAKLYGKELATVEGSKEQIVGIYRNSKVNTKRKYKTVDEVYKALKSREVQAGLVDSFVAANRPDLFSDAAIISRKMIKYPYTYGFVLSGSMKNTHSNLRRYISENSNFIANVVQTTTPKFKVNQDVGAAVSLFDPKSRVLQKNLVVISIVAILLILLGCLHTLLKRRFKKCNAVRHDYKSPYLDDCEILCKEFFSNVGELSENMDKLYESQMCRILKLSALRKRHPRRQELVQIKKVEVASVDSSFVDCDTPNTDGIVVTHYTNHAVAVENLQ